MRLAHNEFVGIHLKFSVRQKCEDDLVVRQFLLFCILQKRLKIYFRSFETGSDKLDISACSRPSALGNRVWVSFRPRVILKTGCLKNLNLLFGVFHVGAA